LDAYQLDEVKLIAFLSSSFLILKKYDYGITTIRGIFMKRYIAAGKFKTECLKMMDEVKASGQEIVITKHRIPIVKLCPIANKENKLFGALKDSVHVKGDLLKPLNEEWNADR
jgi:antitoxin (DNA-binding transcriptional repressor) of toxin-antitoxin stability system